MIRPAKLWSAWFGDARPLPWYARVAVIRRDGRLHFRIAGFINWKHRGKGSDVVNYKRI